MTTAGVTFLDVQQVHQRLEELFLQHQEALLDLDPETALKRLVDYERELVTHIEIEEKVLLPVYLRAGTIPGGPPEFFTGEHRRMREYLGRFVAALCQMKKDGSGLRRRIIKLFDDEAAFKSLCQHHIHREDNIFFPALDRVTTLEERQSLVRQTLAANSVCAT